MLPRLQQCITLERMWDDARVPCSTFDDARAHIHLRLSVYRVNTERRIGFRPFIGEIERESVGSRPLPLYISLPY